MSVCLSIEKVVTDKNEINNIKLPTTFVGLSKQGYSNIDCCIYKGYSPRLKRQIIKIKKKYKEYLIDNVFEYFDTDTERQLITKELYYSQGWFFNKRFFKNTMTIYYATTKQHMKRILINYLDFKDPYAYTIYEDCMSIFKDNEDMVFRLAF